MLVEQVSKIDTLYLRAEMMKEVRSFFAARAVTEVDVPMLSLSGAIDPYIDLVVASCCGKRSYLHSSPEYGMKKLLARGMGDCYQLCHVFRDHEMGERHEAEFTMVEWYRKRFSLEQLIEETRDFIALFLGSKSCQILSYEEAFHTYAGEFPQLIEERDELFANEIEPRLQGLVFLTPYPPEQSALSKKVRRGGELVAERFEVFYNGIELGNGYLELTDLEQLRERLIAANEKRAALGKEIYPLDEQFLQSELPDCAGVAIGFDRLMMLKVGANDIKEVIPFSWKE